MGEVQRHKAARTGCGEEMVGHSSIDVHNVKRASPERGIPTHQHRGSGGSRIRIEVRKGRWGGQWRLIDGVAFVECYDPHIWSREGSLIDVDRADEDPRPGVQDCQFRCRFKTRPPEGVLPK